MNITLIPLGIVLLFLLYCFYFHSEFTYPLLAFEPSATIYDIANTTIGFNSNLGTNISNYWGNERNEAQINYLINISSNKGHSELPKFEVVGKNTEELNPFPEGHGGVRRFLENTSIKR